MLDPHAPWQIREDHLYLHGVAATPTLLYALAPRRAAATINVQRAMALPQALPVFLGADHLPALAHWPAQRPAIVVETIPTVLVHYQTLQTAATLSPQMHIFSGACGIASNVAPDSLQTLWHQHDTTQLCQQLYAAMPLVMPGHTAMDVHRAGDSAHDVWLHHCVAQIAPWIFAVRQFNQSIAALTEHVRRQPRTGDIIFCGLPDEEAQRDILLGQLRNVRTHWVPLCPVGQRDDTPLIDHGMSITPSPHPAVHAASVSILRLLRVLRTTGARYIACRNFSICPSEEYLLPFTELIRATDSMALAAHSDWFTQNGTNMRGGAMFPHALRQLDASHLRVLTMYPDYSARYNDTGRAYSLLPFDYLSTLSTQAPPHRQRTDCTTDVLIAHVSRLPHAHPIITPWIDGLCAFDAAAPAGPRNQRAHRLLLTLHHAVRQLPAPLGTTPFRLLLREFDYVYYAVSRFRAMQHAIPRLAAQYRVRVVGTGWEQAFPAALCEPTITDRAALHDAYRTAGVTIFFSSMYDSAIPSPEACVCLASGGYPIMAAPSLEDNITPASWPPIAANDFATFARTDELPELVATTLTNWDARTQHINTVQARWRSTLLPRGTYALDDLLAQPYPITEAPLPMITDNPAINAAVIHASLAFFAEYCGYPALAAHYWDQTTALPAECRPWREYRAAQLAQSIPACENRSSQLP